MRTNEKDNAIVPVQHAMLCYVTDTNCLKCGDLVVLGRVVCDEVRVARVSGWGLSTEINFSYELLYYVACRPSEPDNSERRAKNWIQLD